MIRISVVILNWNGRNFLEKFLPSVVQHSSIPGVEVVVADNGSTDDSITLLDNQFPDVRVIRFPENYGFAEGYNKALQQIESEYYILLNSDIDVTESWIEPIIELLDADKSIVACMPKIKDYNNRDKLEYAGAAGGFIDRHRFKKMALGKCPECKTDLDYSDVDGVHFKRILTISSRTGKVM